MRPIVFACMLAAAASPAGAQPAPWSPEQVNAGWVFTPAIIFGGLWDSNVTVRQEGNPEVAEMVGLLRPRGEIAFHGKRTRFAAGYLGTLEAYRTLEELTRYDQRGRLQARYAATPRLDISTRHSFTMTPTTDQLELAGLPFTRLGSRRYDGSGGFAYKLSPRATLDADYSLQWVAFDRDPRFARLSGGHSHGLSTSVGYDVTKRLSVNGSWQYRRTLIDAGSEFDAAQDAWGTHHVLGAVAYEVTARTQVHGGGGFALLRVADAGGNRMGPAVRVGVTHATRLASFSADYERMFLPVFGIGGISSNETLRGAVGVPLAGGRYAVNGSVTYRGTQPLDVAGFVQSDAWWTQVSFGWSITRWLSMQAFYADAQQTSTSRGRVDRTRIGLQFSTSKPLRIQ